MMYSYQKGLQTINDLTVKIFYTLWLNRTGHNKYFNNQAPLKPGNNFSCLSVGLHYFLICLARALCSKTFTPGLETIIF